MRFVKDVLIGKVFIKLKIEDNIKSIINYVNLSIDGEENKSASKEKQKMSWKKT